jgi:hypothetical protein
MQQFRRERPTTFLDLPAEIRIEIYNLLLVERQTVRIPGRLLNLYPPVLRVCKQIHAEAAPILYGRNKMRLALYGGDGVPRQWSRSGFLLLGTRYLRLVRRLELVIWARVSKFWVKSIRQTLSTDYWQKAMACKV